jgi:hypothetical protein
MKRTVAVVVALVASGLGACGGAGKSDGGDAAANEQKCSETWKVGTTIDLNTYGGCLNDDGDIEVAITQGCYDANSNYIGQFATFDDRLWVVQKGTDDKTGEGGTPGQVTDVDPKC